MRNLLSLRQALGALQRVYAAGLDASLQRFESYALDSIFAVPAVLSVQPGATMVPPPECGELEEAQLDAELRTLRTQLAAAHAKAAAAETEASALAAELAECAETIAAVKAAAAAVAGVPGAAGDDTLAVATQKMHTLINRTRQMQLNGGGRPPGLPAAALRGSGLEDFADKAPAFLQQIAEKKGHPTK